MKNRKRIYRVSALLLILALLLGAMSTGAEDNGPDETDTVYSDWLSLGDMLRSGENESSNLADFLDRIEISGAELNNAGQYVVLNNVPYTVQLFFSEKYGLQFDDDPVGGSLTYHFPSGFTPSPTSGTIELTGDDGVVRFDFVVSGEYSF